MVCVGEEVSSILQTQRYMAVLLVSLDVLEKKDAEVTGEHDADWRES